MSFFFFLTRRLLHCLRFCRPFFSSSQPKAAKARRCPRHSGLFFSVTLSAWIPPSALKNWTFFCVTKTSETSSESYIFKYYSFTHTHTHTLEMKHCRYLSVRGVIYLHLIRFLVSSLYFAIGGLWNAPTPKPTLWYFRSILTPPPEICLTKKPCM